MENHKPSALELVHRLVFQAMLEIRAQGHEQRNKLVFHLADLFHQVALHMERAALGQMSYQDVLRLLEDRARERGCEQWVEQAREQIEKEKATQIAV